MSGNSFAAINKLVRGYANGDHTPTNSTRFQEQQILLLHLVGVMEGDAGKIQCAQKLGTLRPNFVESRLPHVCQYILHSAPPNTDLLNNMGDSFVQLLDALSYIDNLDHFDRVLATASSKGMALHKEHWNNTNPSAVFVNNLAWRGEVERLQHIDATTNLFSPATVEEAQQLLTYFTTVASLALSSGHKPTIDWALDCFDRCAPLFSQQGDFFQAHFRHISADIFCWSKLGNGAFERMFNTYPSLRGHMFGLSNPYDKSGHDIEGLVHVLPYVEQLTAQQLEELIANGPLPTARHHMLFEHAKNCAQRMHLSNTLDATPSATKRKM